MASVAGRCAELLCPYRASLRHVGQRCQGLQRLGTLFSGSLVRQSCYMHDMCLWLFRASWCSFVGIARWSLRVASAADRCAELSPLLRITVPCRPEMSGASAFSLGTLCLVCSRVRAADTHDVCVWLWHASFGAAFRSWHGGHFGWRVLPTAALSCCAPTEHHCAMSARDVRGFSSVFGYFVFLARSCVRAADMHDVCVWLSRASKRSFQELRGGHFEWRVLLTAAPSCRLFTHHCAMSARDVWGFSFLLGYVMFGLFSRQGC